VGIFGQGGWGGGGRGIRWRVVGDGVEGGGGWSGGGRGFKSIHVQNDAVLASIH